jgi:hypothetical protein
MATAYMQKKATAYADFVNLDCRELNEYSDYGAKAKKRFLNEGRSILRILAQELGLSKYEVKINKAGIAVSGDVTLIGVWDDGDNSRGIYISLSEPAMYVGHPFIFGREYDPDECVFMYKSVQHMKDWSGGRNQWTGFNDFKDLTALSKKLEENVRYLFLVR